MGAVPLIYIISVKYYTWFLGKPLNIAYKSKNYKHQNTGAGLSYSGRHGQWTLPYLPAYLSRIGPYKVNKVIIFYVSFMKFHFLFSNICMPIFIFNCLLQLQIDATFNASS
jgi:hypothetical protein